MTLREGDDYYIENGLYVFTAAFLRRRGYCCASGCRHCPYWPPHSGGRNLTPRPPSLRGLALSEAEGKGVSCQDEVE
ncbi:MAG: DUF5522 domain-containing protein [Dehalococcoidia bacterium]